VKFKKKLIWVAMLLILSLTLSGCSQNQQAIFDAGMKMQNVTSLQQQTTMTFKLSGSGFDPAVQQQVDTAVAFVNNATLNLDTKMNSNEERTVSKSQVDMNLTLQGMNITMPVWVDSDLTGDTPKIIEIFRLPELAKGSLSPEFASKEYVVLNPNNMGAAEQSSMNMSKLAEFSKRMQVKQVAFLTSFAQRFNPDIKVVSKGSRYLETNEGSKSAEIYEIKLNDQQLKEFIRYTVNNSTQDEEAMLFVKEYMDTILKFSQVPEGESSFDQDLKDFEVKKQEFLDQFNLVMDELKDVTLLGDQGLELEYAIVDGYVVKKSGALDLRVELAEINQLMKALNPGQSMTEEATGSCSLKVDFSTVTSNINKPIEIEIPEVNENNSFDYMDLIKALTPPAALEGAVRLAGEDGYTTSRVIGEEYNRGQCANIIVASGLNVTDALSSSSLSKKLDAPILLVGATVEESSEAFDYIASHANPDTKLYIVGGTGVIDTSFETELRKRGHETIIRLGGVDRYETAMAVVDQVNVEYGTPVFLISGESFPDALSTASFVGSKQYPALFTGKNYLSDKTKDYISTNKPVTVYIIGGTAVIPETLEAQVKELVPSANVIRLAGLDRFDTAGAVLNEFSLNPRTVYLANGYENLEALAGSALAAKTSDPVLLINPKLSTLPPATEAYLKKLSDSGYRPMVRAFGGSVVVPDHLIKQAEMVLNGK